MRHARYFVVAWLTLAGCVDTQTDRGSAAEVSILIDASDSFILRPDSSLFSLFDFRHAPGLAAGYRIGIIADRYFTPRVENRLENGSLSEAENKTDDPNFRQKRIRAFYSSFCKDLTYIQLHAREKPELQYSLCYQRIANELSTLSASKAKYKYLVIFSDLLEKSEVFDCYSRIGQVILEKKPDSVISRYLHAYPLPPDLVGTTVFIYHCPENRKDDALFTQMVQVYTKIIESRGGKVVIETTYPTVSVKK
jgi:hypothetical protein